MYPSIDIGDNRNVKDKQRCLLLAKVGLLKPRKWKKGDVVIAKNPRGKGKDDIVKRVVGLANEEVIHYSRHGNQALMKRKIPSRHVWLQGDNMPHSIDSRVYGPVKEELIYGKVMCQVWPKYRTMENTLDYAAPENPDFSILDDKLDYKDWEKSKYRVKNELEEKTQGSVIENEVLKPKYYQSKREESSDE